MSAQRQTGRAQLRLSREEIRQKMEQQTRLPNIPPREGMEQRWVRVRDGGENDIENVYNAKTRGFWEIRPRDTVENTEFIPNIELQGQNGIQIGGLVLMERPAEYGDVERSIQQEASENQISGVLNNQFNDADADYKYIRGGKRSKAGEGYSEFKVEKTKGSERAPIVDD